MIKIPPCGLPMVPLVPMVPLAAENVQGFLVTIGKNGTNSTIGRFADFTIGRTPNVAIVWERYCHMSMINFMGDAYSNMVVCRDFNLIVGMVKTRQTFAKNKALMF